MKRETSKTTSKQLENMKVASSPVDENFRQGTYANFYEYFCDFIETHPYTPPIFQRRRVRVKGEKPPVKLPFEVLLIEWNGVNVPISNELEAINITALHAELNNVKNADSCAISWFRNTMNYFKGVFFTDEEDANQCFIHGKYEGHKDKKGYYFQLNKEAQFTFILGTFKHAIAAHRWYMNDPDWDEDIGEGWLYVIMLPSESYGFIVKYGRTISLKNRYNVYLQNLDEKFKSVGFYKVGERMVKNISAGEHALGEEFEKLGYQRLKSIDSKFGNEEFYIEGNSNQIFEEAQAVFMSFVNSLIEKKKKKNKTDKYIESLVCYKGLDDPNAHVSFVSKVKDG